MSKQVEAFFEDMVASLDLGKTLGEWARTETEYEEFLDLTNGYSVCLPARTARHPAWPYTPTSHHLPGPRP
jgi:hypothetical protein